MSRGEGGDERQEESLQFLESLHFLTGSHRVLQRTVFLDYGA